MKFEFDSKKNELLIETRNISFPMIIEAIAENGVLLNIEHPNSLKYPNQFMLVIEYNKYTWCVPYSIHGDVMYLRTIFPNREYRYLLEEKEK